MNRRGCLDEGGMREMNGGSWGTKRIGKGGENLRGGKELRGKNIGREDFGRGGREGSVGQKRGRE
jgi:hypothetical protein